MEVDLTPPGAEITPADVTMPTEPDDGGVDHDHEPGAGEPAGLHARLNALLARAVEHLPEQVAEHPVTQRMTQAMGVAGASTIMTRAQWGARHPTSGYQKMAGHPMVTYHYEGPHMGDYAHAQCIGIVRTIQAYHMDHNGWIDIAYNALVCRHGTIYEGRGPTNRSAANGTNPGNGGSYAVCYIAGVDDPLTDEAKAGLLDARLWLQRAGSASADTKVHSDWFATACPGDIVRNWQRGGLAPPPGYNAMPDPAPNPAPNGGNVLATSLPDAIGFIDDPTSDGGWLVTKAGAVYTKAPSGFFGSLGNVKLNAPISAFLPTPTGKGYWLFGEDGGVFNFGDAPFNGTYGQFATEYAQGIHKVAGAYFRGNPGDPASWRYSLVSSRLESYDI